MGEFTLRGWGVALPESRLGNEELGRAVGMDADAIAARTGIEERRVAGPGDSASSLGVAAARAALARADVDPADLDLVVLSTYTPDHLLCPTAPKVAHRLGAVNAGAFDVNAACSGGVTAMLTASALLGSGAFRCALVVAADTTTRFIRPDDAKTRLVFGDGAAALVFGRPVDGEPRWEILSAVMGADGGGESLFHVPAGGSVHPPAGGTPDPALDHSVVMNGRAIFRFGIEQGATLIQQLCAQAGISPRDVRWVVPHQANLRIISALIEKSAVPAERWYVNIGRYGNTASPSVPLALSELLEGDRLRSGDIVLLAAFGAGLTWSGLALRVA